MIKNCDTIQPLISGYLDRELNHENRTLLEDHIEGCTVCKDEFEKMKRLVSAATGLRAAPPPDEIWDTFLEGVYNRMERRTGWTVFIVGVAALALYASYLFLAEPWASALVKLLLAIPFTGLAILFVSVLRQRLFMAQTDRYSREVER